MNDGITISSRSTGFNLLPFAAMVLLFIQPVLTFWLYVWGPLRPFAYPAGDLLPGFGLAVVIALVSAAPIWLPPGYYAVRAFEMNGRLYELLGIRLFRAVVPDGDIANRTRRRKHPSYRFIPGRKYLPALGARTIEGERSHLVLLMFGAASALYAAHIGWTGWAAVLVVGNVLANVYPLMLQRYTRSRLACLSSRKPWGARS